MKHLFFIHSHITYLVAIAVARKNKINTEDILLITYRGYNPINLKIKSIEFNIQENSLSKKNIIKKLLAIRKINTFLKKFDKDKFVWYFPQTSFIFFKYLINHPKCDGFNIIEEGSASYLTKDCIDSILNPPLKNPSIIKKIKNFFGEKRIEFIDSRYKVAYGCSEESFPGYKRKELISISGNDIENHTEDITSVIAFDAILEYNLAAPENFIKCIENLFTHLLKNKEKTIHYKLHPQQYIDTKYSQKIQIILNENPFNLKFIELPKNFCLESLATKKETKFYVFFSSIGIYASIFGCEVYSLSKKLSIIDENYNKIFSKLPESIKKFYIFI